MFRRKKQTIALLAACSVFLTFSLAGCGSQSNQSSSQGSQKEEITFVNWASAEESSRPYINQVIQDFETQNPNITVKSVPIAISDIANQLTTMTTGGSAPDIAQININEGVTLANMGILTQTDSLVPKDYASDSTFKKSWDLGAVNGKHYGMPWTPQPQGFYYNKKLMQEAGLDPNNPPKTWDEFMKAMDTARQKLPKEDLIIGLDTTVRTIGLDQQWPIMRSFGVNPVDGNKVQVNTPEMVNYATWLRKMVTGGYTLPGKKFGEFRPIAAQHHLLFMIDEPQFKGILQSLDKNLTDEAFYQEWGVSALPAGIDGKHYSAPDDHHLILFKDSKHQEAAMKFAEFLINSEQSAKGYNAKIGVLPATKIGFDQYQDVFGDPVRATFIKDVIPSVVSLPVGPNLPKISTEIMTGVQQIITTNDPIPTILNNMQTKLEGIVNGK
ncbi:extracellular solute-binding protein [Desulfitobacterium sp.]|uniref:extracellular solute-binding protein n=1 Tax=Desulfitobacterium sp. TaxID=49981 RepID=UPI002B1EB143|nr:extracellular solute-binding protein [Desulfitobacterium sp.]MEA4900678.1 extracellular solute-binding protein [Desulfitobacterium sp.]